MKLLKLTIFNIVIIALGFGGPVHASRIPEHVADNMRSAFVNTCTSRYLELRGPEGDPADIMPLCYCYINYLIDNTTLEQLVQFRNAGSDWPQYMQDDANAHCN